MRVLIADDEAEVARLVRDCVEQVWPGCAVTIAADGREALRRFAAEAPALVILDVAMPPPDGLAVCRRIRLADPAVPILMLTGRDTRLDEVAAFDAGADDYLTKPWDLDLLAARLRALLRRAASGAGDAPPAAVDWLVLDATGHAARAGGAPVALTATEYVLLEHLARHRGAPVPHRALLERVWGPEYAHNTHYLKVLVNRLRKKLGDAPDGRSPIEAVRGVGYRLRAAPGPRHRPGDAQDVAG